MNVIFRFLLDDPKNAKQRVFRNSEHWPWAWPPHVGMTIVPRGFRNNAFKVTRVVHDMATGNIVADFINEPVGGDIEEAAEELRAMGYIEDP